MSARNYCFTLNNYTQEDEDHLKTVSEGQNVRYLVYGKEIAPTTGTPHLQGFISLRNPKPFKRVKEILNERIHLEEAKGTFKENVAYCIKDRQYVEFAKDRKSIAQKHQGHRTDLDCVKQAFKEGQSIQKISENDDVTVQGLRFAELLYKYQKTPKLQKRIIHWYYGSTGTGKTYKAVIESGDDYWMSGRTLKWWDGYQGQKSIIIDDFRADFCTFHELLRILDQYPYRVETKGSSMWIQSTTTDIYITSCYPPTEVYQTREDINQLIRRIDIIKEFKSQTDIITHKCPGDVLSTDIRAKVEPN